MERNRLLVFFALLASALMLVLWLARRVSRTPDVPEAASEALAPKAEDPPVSAGTGDGRVEGREAMVALPDVGSQETVVRAPQTSIVQVLDREGEPLPEGLVLFGRALRQFEADADGRVVVDVSDGEDSDAVAFAPRHVPALLVIAPATDVEIHLEEDPGVELSVRWSGSDLPAAGGVVRHRHRAQPATPSTAWREAAWRAVYGDSFACDAQGAVRVFGVDFRTQGSEGAVSVLLVVEHPETLETWVEPYNFREDPFTGGRTVQVVHLDRGASPIVLEFEDPARSPLAGRPLRVDYWQGVTESRTDSMGRLELPFRPDAPEYLSRADWFGAFRYELDLGAGRRWLGARYVESGERSIAVREVASFREIEGSVRHATPSRFEVASAAVPWPEWASENEPIGEPDWLKLDWLPVAEDGSFHVDRGWQGATTSLLLKDVETQTIVAWTIVESGAPPVLQPGPLCHLEIRALDPIPSDLRMDLESRAPFQGLRYPARSIEGLELPLALDVPQGMYTLFGWAFENRFELAKVDARKDTAVVELRVAIPERVTLQGTVEGSIAGAIPRARVLFADGRGFVAEGVSDENGVFSVQVPSADSWKVSVLAADPELRPSEPWFLPSVVQATDDLTELRFVREEAEIALHWDREEPMWEHMHLDLQRKNSQGRFVSLCGTDTDRRSTWRVLVPPGEYRVDSSLTGRGYVSVVSGVQTGDPFVLLPHGTQEVEVDPPDVALLLLQIDHPPGLMGTAQLREITDDAEPVEGTFQLSERTSQRPQGAIFMVRPGSHHIRMEGSLRPYGPDADPETPVAWEETLALAPREILRRNVWLGPRRGD